MPDDLDNMIRGAMKVLDEQTPSGYFDAAPNQILARLEDGSMQQGTTSLRGKSDALMGPPVVPDDADTNPTPKVEASDVAPLPQKPAADRDEDSGLHDIRNLAQSTKQRLSSRRITMNPPASDDVLASSSGSFANIALPQPAKMVALPDLEDLPSKQEVIAAQKAAAKARKNKPTAEPKLESKDVLAPQATANAALAAMSATPIAEAAELPVRQAFTLPSMERKKSKGPLLAVLGLSVAAAAGGFVMMGSKDEKAATSANTADSAPAQVAVATPATGAAAPDPAAAPPPAPVEEAKAAEPEAAAVAEDDEAKSEPRAKRAGKAGGAKKEVEAKPETKPETKTETKTETKVEAPKDLKRPDGSKGGEQQAEQSFDSLLKEAGVEDKKDVKPKLDKKSLSGDDFKKGMSAVNGKAQGCYKGNQGTATVKLTIAPSGAVTKVSVGGQFAGKPEGTCVESAVKAATFPAWDGGPQSFNYSYMLSD
jgi:hypothetical protein